MSKYRTKPKPVHLNMLEKMDSPACVTGRGETTDDPEKVTCKSCRSSGSMSRLLMRRMRAKASGQ